MFIALWLILFWDNIVCYLNCLKENEVKFYQRWREKEADTEALKGNRTVNRRGKKDFCFFLLFKTLSVSLSGEIRCKYRSRTIVSFVLGIVFLWTNGIKIPFHFVFHLTGLSSSAPAHHYGCTSLSSGTSMFDYHFFSSRKSSGEF